MSENANHRSGQDRRRLPGLADARPAHDPEDDWPEVVRPFERRGCSREVLYRSGADRRSESGTA